MPQLNEEDIVQGSSLVVDEKGPVARRRFRVSGLRGQPHAEAQGAALLTLAQGGIAYGNGHPGISGVFCSRLAIEPFANGNDSVYATAEYSTPQRNPAAGGGYTVKVSSANGTRVQAFGGDGKLLPPVTWTDPVDNTVKNNYVQLQVESSHTVVEISRMERTSPLQNSRAYRNKVNQSPMWGFDAKEVLCRAIDADVLSGGPGGGWLWMVTYRFEGAPSVFAGGANPHSAWEELSVFRDAQTGRIPDAINITDGKNNGYVWHMPYALVDFAPLNLPDVTL